MKFSLIKMLSVRHEGCFTLYEGEADMRKCSICGSLIIFSSKVLILLSMRTLTGFQSFIHTGSVRNIQSAISCFLSDHITVARS